MDKPSARTDSAIILVCMLFTPGLFLVVLTGPQDSPKGQCPSSAVQIQYGVPRAVTGDGGACRRLPLIHLCNPGANQLHALLIDQRAAKLRHGDARFRRGHAVRQDGLLRLTGIDDKDRIA